MKLKKRVILIFFLFSWAFLIFYIYKNSDSIECKSAVLFSISSIQRSELDSLKFNIARLIISDNEIRKNIQKNSLILNADEKNLTIISQIEL